MPDGARAPSPTDRRWRAPVIAVYAILLALFFIRIAAFHDSLTGWTTLITFGDRFAAERLPQLRDLPIHTFANSYGYDGQWYAQLAVAGNPLAPELDAALDAPPYRTRRVLLPLIVHVVAGGDPARVLTAYALSNVACWLVLALLLAWWWFPPTDLHNLLRWTGVLFGHGTLASVVHSLTDTPALLVITLAMRCAERNKGRLAAVMLAAAGLVRETSILATAAFVPSPPAGRSFWRRAAITVALVVLPTMLWSIFLVGYYGGTGSARNFALPFVSYARKLYEVGAGSLAAGLSDDIRDSAWMVIALGTQVAFVWVRPHPRNAWWRVAAAYSILWLCIGWAPWEGSAPAAARALLPLTLAFNVLVPRTRVGLALLLGGNLTVLSAFAVLQPKDVPPVLAYATTAASVTDAVAAH